jgi:hypothetical protein
MACTSCSACSRTPGWSPRSRASSRRPRQRAGEPENRHATSRRFNWTTRRSSSCERRVVAQTEFTGGEANPRFVVTSLKRAECRPKRLYEKVYCARRDMENPINECQLELYADHTSTATMQANQLRLWFASMAYVLLCAVRGIGLLTRRWPARLAAPSVLSCSRSERSCASASVASRSR